jgi:hypothetical protein
MKLEEEHTNVPPGRINVIRQAVFRSEESLAKSIFKNETLRPGSVNFHGSVIKSSSVESLKEFKWNSLKTEVRDNTPILFQTLLESTNQKKNKEKIYNASTVICIVSSH